MLNPTALPANPGSDSVTLTIPYQEWRRILYALALLEQPRAQQDTPISEGWIGTPPTPVEDSQPGEDLPEEILSQPHTREGWIPAGRQGTRVGIDPDAEKEDVNG